MQKENNYLSQTIDSLQRTIFFPSPVYKSKSFEGNKITALNAIKRFSNAKSWLYFSQLAAFLAYLLRWNIEDLSRLQLSAQNLYCKKKYWFWNRILFPQYHKWNFTGKDPKEFYCFLCCVVHTYKNHRNNLLSHASFVLPCY